MPHEVKPHTSFLRPQNIYFSLFALLAIHVLTLIGEMPASVQCVINSLACLYIGAMSTSKIRFNKSTNLLEKEKNQNDERMTSKDALQFPIYLSAYLFGLYLLLKHLDEVLLKSVITIFFSSIGVVCLMGIIEDAIGNFMPVNFSDIVMDRTFNLNLILSQKQFPVKLTRLNLLSLSIAIIPLSIYLGSRNWLCNNLFGIAFSVSGIANFTVIPNFKTAYLMLWGLFFYDIFWVYGTDVMVTVAKSIDAPIKLQFPFLAIEDGQSIRKFSMLGLGDIVVPGIFVGMCLKYDVDRQIKKVKRFSEFDLSYFGWCFVGYTLGIVTTLAVMIIFQHPQPALLFLVPGCTLSVLLKALLDGKVQEFWSYEAEFEDKLQKEGQQTALYSNNEKVK